MKSWKKVFVSVFSVALLLSLMAVDAYAAKEYTYTVTIYAGVQGTFSGVEELYPGEHGTVSYTDEKITITGLRYGDQFSFNAQAEGAIKLHAGSKYYVKGIRKSGRDNATAGSVFRVTKDQEYVVAYGVKCNEPVSKTAFHGIQDSFASLGAGFGSAWQAYFHSEFLRIPAELISIEGLSLGEGKG